MKVLIDTHCFLWAMEAPEKLAPRMRDWLEKPTNEVFFSTASAWEILIKVGIDKLRLPQPPSKFIADRLKQERIAELPIRLEHAYRLESLPPIHRDPFDRILIAQAQTEGLTLMTVDPVFKRYKVPVF